MNRNELELPEKIFPVEYAGFFDFNGENIYGCSVINRDDYPNAEQIANEIAHRYNSYEPMQQRIKELHKALDDIASENYDDDCDTDDLFNIIDRCKQTAREALQSSKQL